MRKQYKSSKIKNEKNYQKKKILMGVPLKGYVASEVIFRFGARKEKQYCGNIQWLMMLKFHNKRNYFPQCLH